MAKVPCVEMSLFIVRQFYSLKVSDAHQVVECSLHAGQWHLYLVWEGQT